MRPGLDSPAPRSEWRRIGPSIRSRGGGCCSGGRLRLPFLSASQMPCLDHETTRPPEGSHPVGGESHHQPTCRTTKGPEGHVLLCDVLLIARLHLQVCFEGRATAARPLFAG